MSPLPAETHQHSIHPTTCDDVLDLLLGLLGGHAPACPSETTLEQLQITDADVWDMWTYVREEFGERSLGPELDLSPWEPSMTLDGVAAIMASVLTGDVSPGDECSAEARRTGSEMPTTRDSHPR
ncbi:MAG: hypothetical protein ACRDYZ_06710 [Acidimicrobiales bacterium]